MKNSLRIKKIVSLTLIILLVFATKVYAVSDSEIDSYSTTISASSSSVRRGSSVTITIGLADISIKSGDKGICAYTAELQFDSSIFEYEGSNGTSKWEKPFYEDRMITGNTDDGEVIDTTQAIGTITFKVKDNAKLGETTISLIDFSGSTAESDIIASDKSVKVVIEDKVSNNGANNSDNIGGNNNPNKKPTTDNEANDTSVIKGTVLPKTGVSNIAILVGIGICSILAINYLIKWKVIEK